MEQFNLALLGKQVWRLIHNIESLFYKVFKAKYFPNCSILDAGIKTIGSYAWQSILKARSLVRWVSTWQIGNGEKVLIKSDNWLLDPFTQVISPQKKFPNNTHVCALIDEEGPCWLEDRIREELRPHEANAVLDIFPSATVGLKILWFGKDKEWSLLH